MSYGIPIFGSTKKTHSITSIPFKIRLITGALYFVSNPSFHSQLRLPYVTDFAKQFHLKYYGKLH